MDGKPVTTFEGDNFYLSNFYPSTIKVVKKDGTLTFPTAEHMFQAAKYDYMIGGDQERLDYVLSIAHPTVSPGMAKKIGRTVKIDLASWETNKINAMREVCKAKFDQHEDLRAKLLQTSGMLVEGNGWGDKFWGRVDGKGLNVLGSLLIELRGYYLWSKGP